MDNFPNFRGEKKSLSCHHQENHHRLPKFFPMEFFAVQKFHSTKRVDLYSPGDVLVVKNHGDRKPPNWGLSLSKWPKWLIIGVILTTYKSWDDPPSSANPRPSSFGMILYDPAGKVDLPYLLNRMILQVTGVIPFPNGLNGNYLPNRMILQVLAPILLKRLETSQSQPWVPRTFRRAAAAPAAVPAATAAATSTVRAWSAT